MPTSIRQLTLIGFMIVVLPLIVATVTTVIQVDRLSNRMRTAVFNAAQAVQASRIIVSQVLAMERSAGQYLVLGDADLLQRYRKQRVQMLDAVGALNELDLERSTRQDLRELQSREHTLFNRLMDSKAQATKATSAQPENYLVLSDLVRTLPFEVSFMIAEEADSVSLRVLRLQRWLLIEALALIPLAMVMAVVFSVVITRPLRELTVAIHQLGRGDFSAPVYVSGPRDIRELSARLEWLRNRLSELEQQKMTFLRHVSHELKTPLTAIREGTELLNDEVVGQLNEEQGEITRILRDNSIQLQTQVETLLKFNKAFSEDSALDLEEINLRNLIEHVLADHKLTMRARHVHIRVKQSSKDLSVMGDREQLRVLFDNLVSNAIKYSPTDGEVTVALSESQTHALIDVTDQGPGINAPDRDRVFEAFYQGSSNPNSPVKGTGLGLAISQRYAKLHQGAVEILDSQQGAHLRVVLPLKLERPTLQQ